MTRKRGYLLILLLVSLTAGILARPSSAWQKGTKGQGGRLAPENPSGLELTAILPGSAEPLIAEQAPVVSLSLNNRSETAVKVISLDNDFTPTFELQDSAGRILGE